MRKILVAIIVFQISIIGKSQMYDTSLVKFETEIINENSKIDIIYLSKKNQKIKTKYLAYMIDNQSVYDRFKEFSKQNILIYYSTAATLNFLSMSKLTNHLDFQLIMGSLLIKYYHLEEWMEL